MRSSLDLQDIIRRYGGQESQWVQELDDIKYGRKANPLEVSDVACDKSSIESFGQPDLAAQIIEMQQQEDAYQRIKRKYLLQTETEEFEQKKKEQIQ